MATQLCSLCGVPVLTKQLCDGGATYVHCRHCDSAQCPRARDSSQRCSWCDAPSFAKYDGAGRRPLGPPEPPKGLFSR